MNITDALDSYLTAKLKVGEWEQEFVGRFYAPVLELMVQSVMETAKSNPDVAQKLEQRLSPQALRKFRGE